jgi:EmrB/QacA subfamily drug resistance transporter
MEGLKQKKLNLNDNLYKNRRIILLIVFIGIFMSSLDAYMVNIALPNITTSFSVNLTKSQWVITGYLLVMTGLFIPLGKASEYTGKTKMFIAGFTIFTVSSLACGIATNLDQLTIFRLIQAAGASMVLGVGGAIIFMVALPEERGRVMGYLGAVTSIAALLGPVIGGFITELLGWQYIFLINVPIGILLFIFALKYLKIPEVTSEKFEMDWIGALSLIVSVTSFLMFCSELQSGVKITSPLAIYGVLGLLSLVAFILRESKYEKPLLDLSIFKNKLFSLAILSMVLFNMAIVVANFLGPFYFQGVMDYNPSQVGLLFLMVPLLMVVASPLGGWIYDKHHHKYAAAFGVLLAAFAFFLMAYAFSKMNIILIILSFVLWGVGRGLYNGPNGTETMSALSPQRTAVASTVMFTTGSLAMAIGISLATVALTLELSMAGYNGAVLAAGHALLSSSISAIILVAGFVCLISSIVAVLRNI